MKYEETNSDSDSDIDDYNYNDSTNNWSTLTGDKINQQTNSYNNSFLDRINKKLESLQTEERSIINTRVEKKSDSFLDLLERMKALNSEREFEPHHRSPLAKTMIDNWNNRQKMTDIKNSKKDNLIETSDERNDVKILKTTLTESKEDGHIMQQKLGMIEVEKEKVL